MLRLKRVQIHKYKSIELDQVFDVDDSITILVGMNESGKTAILEALAKSNYFTDDEKFKFNLTHDFPRREKKQVDKKGEDPKAITCTYSISKEILSEISEDIGEKIFSQDEFSITSKYSDTKVYSPISCDLDKFLKIKFKELEIKNDKIQADLKNVNSQELDWQKFLSKIEDEEDKSKIENLSEYFENKWNWPGNCLGEYIARIHLSPNLPKYLYYDEYYNLPSSISIEDLQREHLDEDDLKTAKALFELAEIDIDELIQSDDYEDYKAELEATQVTISDELFKYWSTNKNLSIEFDINKRERSIPNPPNANNQIVEHLLQIRVRNERARVTLPLKNRSRGFNWFFSFLVWFKKIQEDAENSYILLLDEPGLNLHASAQEDLLSFLEDLAKDYQLIYTTHSPFMIDSDKLQRIRTVLETGAGTNISDSIQEKDPNTLFPLQAALGYNIAQNLFISKNNLLVEGVSDLIYIQTISGILQSMGKESLAENITIVPVGGLDKVATFISLLRGSKLNLVCALDSYSDAKSKARVEDMIKQKIIKGKNIIFFDEFLPDHSRADIEDLFSKSDYLFLFNQAFESEYSPIDESDLNTEIDQILIQINNKLSIETFNHYRPASQLLKKTDDQIQLSDLTLSNFEKLVKKINSLF